MGIHCHLVPDIKIKTLFLHEVLIAVTARRMLVNHNALSNIATDKTSSDGAKCA